MKLEVSDGHLPRQNERGEASTQPGQNQHATVKFKDSPNPSLSKECGMAAELRRHSAEPIQDFGASGLHDYQPCNDSKQKVGDEVHVVGFHSAEDCSRGG